MPRGRRETPQRRARCWLARAALNSALVIATVNYIQHTCKSPGEPFSTRRGLTPLLSTCRAEIGDGQDDLGSSIVFLIRA
jgi:hypothetical protein